MLQLLILLVVIPVVVMSVAWVGVLSVRRTSSTTEVTTPAVRVEPSPLPEGAVGEVAQGDGVPLTVSLLGEDVQPDATHDVRARDNDPGAAEVRLRSSRSDEAPAATDARWASLTARERETATLCLLKYKEIAARMGISVEGVKKHSQNARAKLGVRDKVALALYVARMGALAPPNDGAAPTRTAEGAPKG